jgi:hypothetical protein
MLSLTLNKVISQPWRIQLCSCVKHGLSLVLHADLKGWWIGDEQDKFYKALKDFKTSRGVDLRDGDVYSFWIDE